MGRSNRGFVLADVDVVRLVIPSGYSVSPPQLPTDAPVLNVSHPSEVGVLPLLGYKFDGSCFNRLDSGPCELFGINVPLQGEPRFDDDA